MRESERVREGERESEVHEGERAWAWVLGGVVSSVFVFISCLVTTRVESVVCGISWWSVSECVACCVVAAFVVVVVVCFSPPVIYE